VLEGTSIELIGSGSFDPDGAISLHEWSYIPVSGVPAPGPFENGPVTVADPAAFDAPEVNRDGARLNFELRVRDDGSPALDDTDTTFVNIIDRDDPDPNQPPVIEGSGRPVTAAPGGIVTFQPGLSDPNGDPLRYNWNQASGPNVANFLTPAGGDLQGPPYNADLSFTVPVSAQQGDQIRFRLLVEEIDGPFQAFSEPLFTVNVSGEPVDPPP
jgi:hypothetical protein